MSAYMTVAEVAAKLERTTARVYQLLSAGELPHEQKYGRVVIPRKALERFVAKRGASL